MHLSFPLSSKVSPPLHGLVAAGITVVKFLSSLKSEHLSVVAHQQIFLLHPEMMWKLKIVGVGEDLLSSLSSKLSECALVFAPEMLEEFERGCQSREIETVIRILKKFFRHGIVTASLNRQTVKAVQDFRF